MSSEISGDLIAGLIEAIKNSELSSDLKNEIIPHFSRIYTSLRSNTAQLTKLENEIQRLNQAIYTAQQQGKSTVLFIEDLKIVKSDKAIFEGALRADNQQFRSFVDTYNLNDTVEEISNIQNQVKSLLNLRTSYNSIYKEKVKLQQELINYKSEQNKLKIEGHSSGQDFDQLNKLIEESDSKIKGITEIEKNLKQEISDKNIEIENLKAELELKNFESSLDINETMNTTAATNNQDLIDALRNLTQQSKIEVNKFKGNPKEALNWLEEYESECESVGITDDNVKLQKVRIFLKDAAKDWYTNNHNNFTTWDVFKGMFREHYLPSTNDAYLHKLVFEVKQSAFEPVINYIDKKQKNCLKFNRRMSVESQISIILNGMLPEIASRLRPFACITIEELISKAKIIEECLKQGIESEINTVMANNNKNEESNNTKLLAMMENLSSEVKSLKMKNQPRIGFGKWNWPTSNRTTDGRPYCHYCRREGHSYFNCRQRQEMTRNNFNNGLQNNNNTPFHRFNNQNRNGGNNRFINNRNHDNNVNNRNNRANPNRNAVAMINNENNEREEYTVNCAPISRPLINLDTFIDGIPTRAMLDTGASVTLLNTDIA